MYVCNCNGYRDSEIESCARRGVRSVDEAYASLGGPPCCGRCIPMAQEMIDAVHRRAAAGGGAPLGALLKQES